MAAGADGAIWFTESGANKIGRITTTGTISEYAVPTVDSVPYDIAVGPNATLWFTEQRSSKIGQITITH
jgi:virginiamycin B lyase